MGIQFDPDKPNPEYVRNEVDFLKSMEEGMKLESNEISTYHYLVLILSQEMELGFKICKSLKYQLGEQARILRFHKPMSLSRIKEIFAPDVIISDSNLMLQAEQGDIKVDRVRTSNNGFLFFLNKEKSGFTAWLCAENHMQHIHSAWHTLHGY